MTACSFTWEPCFSPENRCTSFTLFVHLNEFFPIDSLSPVPGASWPPSAVAYLVCIIHLLGKGVPHVNYDTMHQVRINRCTKVGLLSHSGVSSLADLLNTEGSYSSFFVCTYCLPPQSTSSYLVSCCIGISCACLQTHYISTSQLHDATEVSCMATFERGSHGSLTHASQRILIIGNVHNHLLPSSVRLGGQ